MIEATLLGRQYPAERTLMQPKINPRAYYTQNSIEGEHKRDLLYGEMRAGIDAIKTATRALGALTAKQDPDPADIQALREYDESKKGRDFDELACDVTQIALRHRAAMRAAGAR